MPELKIIVNHEAGLHARPLALFVKNANEFESDIQVSSLTSGKGPVNGKSILNLLMLAVTQGQEILIEATGTDAEDALAALNALIERNFEKDE